MKLKVKDTNGRVFHVSDECVETIEDTEDTKLQDKDEEFSAEEIKLLKKLIPHLDELLNLLEIEDADDHSEFDSDEIEVESEEETEETSEDVIEDSEPEAEETVEDDEEAEVKVVHDSKKSFGSIERRGIQDSVVDEIERNNEIANAWAKRYGGK